MCFLPQTSVLPFLLALNTWRKHIWECSQTTEGDRSECVCTCVCVCAYVCGERKMPFSIKGQSTRNKMLTKLCCEKWFISTTVNLKACYISSSNLPNFVQASTVPSAETQSKTCSFICPLCVFVARPFQTL